MYHLTNCTKGVSGYGTLSAARLRLIGRAGAGAAGDNRETGTWGRV